MHILEKIKKNVTNKSFKYDVSPENLDSMENAKCLITDNSGIAVEYTLMFKRPVLYLDDKEKLHNSEVSDYSDFINLEDDIKKKFGVKFNNTNFETIDRLIDKSVIDFKNRKLEIDEYANKSFYNYDNTVHFFMNNKEILK